MPEFYSILFLLKTAGLVINYPKNRLTRYTIILVQALLFGLELYKALFMFIYLLTRPKHDHTSTGTLIICCLSIEAVFSMIFVMYWKYKGHIDSLNKKLIELNKNYPNSTNRTNNRIILINASAMCIACLFSGIITTILAYDQRNERTMIDRRAQEMIFYGSFSPILTVLITIYGFIVSLLVLSYYTTITNMLAGSLESFNKNLEKELKVVNENLIEKVLFENYSSHLQITHVVYMANDIFKIYTFVIFVLNMSITMIALLSTFLGFKASWESTIFTIPVLYILIDELILLTIFPAKIKSTIRGVQKVLSESYSIWKPYNEKTYQIANAFVNHVNQEDLGISLWGFTIISNRLILTTLSLTLTYLALVVQMRGMN